MVVGLGVVFILVAVLAVREFRKRRIVEKDTEMERLKLTGSTYKDVKKRYLK